MTLSPTLSNHPNLKLRVDGAIRAKCITVYIEHEGYVPAKVVLVLTLRFVNDSCPRTVSERASVVPFRVIVTLG